MKKEKVVMKKQFVFLFAMLILVAFAIPANAAKDKADKPAKEETKQMAKAEKSDFKAKIGSNTRCNNVEMGFGRTVCGPFKIIGAAVTGVLDTVTLKKPAAILNVPKRVRQELVDTVESAGRTVVAAEPIPMDEVGAVNTKVTDAGVDWLVDGVAYGVATGAIVHNSVETSHVHRYLLDWKAGALTGAGVALTDAASKAAGNE